MSILVDTDKELVYIIPHDKEHVDMVSEKFGSTLVERVFKVYEANKGVRFIEQFLIHLNFVESVLPAGTGRDEAYKDIRDAYHTLSKQIGGECNLLYALID